jgi:hypothetical protein
MSKHAQDNRDVKGTPPAGKVLWSQGSLVRKKRRGWEVICRPARTLDGPTSHALPPCSGLTCYCGECLTPLIKFHRGKEDPS